jgi:tetratricopeptide (TPR) repeat protein
MFLGYVRLQQENYDGALASLETAKRLGTGTGTAKLDDKAQTSLYNNLGIVYWKKERYADALAAYKRALELNKDDVDARYNLAFGLLSQKQYSDAIPHLLQLRAINPNDNAFQASINDGLAEAYENTGKLKEALGALKRVMELNKNDPAARYNFALMLSRTGRVADAITTLVETNKMAPQHAPTLLLLGDLYTQQRKWDLAQKTLKKYVQLQPDNFSGWFSLGVSYDYGAMFDEALEAYSKAETIQPKDTAVKNNIGRIHFKRKNQEQATAKLREALALDPTFDDARINLALSLAAQEKYDEANEEWKNYIQKIKTELGKQDLIESRRKIFMMRLATAQGAMAENYLKSKAYADAVKTYRAVLEITPDNMDALSNLGLALYHTRQLPDAAKIYRGIIEKDPTNAVAHNNLGVVLEALKRPTEALKYYQRAVQLKPDYSEADSNAKRLSESETKGTGS